MAAVGGEDGWDAGAERRPRPEGEGGGDGRYAAVLVLALAGLTALAWSTLAGPLPRPFAGLASAPTADPTEADALADRREAALQFANDDPESGDAAIVVPVIAAHLTDEDPVVRTAGATSVARIGMADTPAAGSLRAAVMSNEALVESLLGALVRIDSAAFDEDIVARSQAATAIGWLWMREPSPTVEQVLVGAYQAEVHREVRSAIVDALCLGRYASPGTEAVLRDAMADYDANLAAEAAACHAERFSP